MRIPNLALVCLLTSLTTQAAHAQALGPEHVAGWKWRLIGPSNPAGRAWRVTGSPGRPKTLYVTTAAGGLWKTINNGTTFEPIFDGPVSGGPVFGKFGSGSTSVLAVAPSDPDILWLGTGEAANTRANSIGTGIYKSTDAGATWTHAGLGDSQMIAEIAIHPSDPNVVYVAVMGHLWGANDERGLFKTVDGGEIWEKVLYIDDTTGCNEVELDPRNPDVLYAAMWQRFRYGGGDMDEAGPNSGLFRSTDGGAHWERLREGLPTVEMSKIEVIISRQDSNVVYANILTGEPGSERRGSPEGGLYRSDDGGLTWGLRTSRQTSYYYDHLYLDPTNHDNVWMPVFELSRSRDGGLTWEQVNMRHVHNDLHSMWIDPTDTEHMVVCGDGGVSITYDEGATWQQTVLPIAQFYEVSVDDQDPYYVIGGMQDTSNWLGPHRTYDVEGITLKDWIKLRHIGDGMASATDPRDPNIIYMTQQFGSLERLDLRTWDRVALKPTAEALAKQGVEQAVRYNWTPGFALSRHDPDYVYFGSNHVFRIHGATGAFEVISPDLTWQQDRRLKGVDDGYHSYGTVFSIAESPVSADILWAGADDGPIWVTGDRGGAWTQVDGNLPEGSPVNCVVAEIEASRFDEDTAYVALDCHARDDMQPHLYRTSDRGRTWTDISGNLPMGPAYTIREDPFNPSALYAGTEFGVFVTIDGGVHWARLNGNLPTSPVRALALQARDRDLVAGTFGRAIWVTDIRPFGELTPAVLAEPLFLFEVETATKFKTRVSYGNTIEEMNGDMFFRGENPEYGTLISYHLKSVEDAVSIEILDPKGAVLRHMTGPATRGLHRVNWDLLPDGAGEIGRRGRETPEERAFASQVPVGTYAVRVTAGAASMTRPVTVRSEPEGPRQVQVRR